MKKISFSGVSASMILACFLQGMKIKEKEEVSWIENPNLKTPPLDSFKFFSDQIALAKKDTRFAIVPKNSIFRRKSVPLLVWYVSQKEKAKTWQEKGSEKIIKHIEQQLSDLTSTNIRGQLLELLQDDLQGSKKLHAIAGSPVKKIIQQEKTPTVKENVNKLLYKQDGGKKDKETQAADAPQPQGDGGATSNEGGAGE